jgi:phosphatidylserine/phosphatidylglycerophosphate/cardiolipin synthase-like enzyme
VVSTAPDRTRSLLEGLSSPYDAPVRAAEMALANGGETLTLRREADGATSTVVQTIGYEDAAAGEVYRPTAKGWAWAPLGRPSLDPAAGGAGSARAFVLPDSPAAALAPIRQAEDRVLVAGYTLTSRRVAAALVAAAERGVDVRVLLEGDPVGGLSAREARQLDRLVAAGVAVRLVGGPRARYRYHHAKYAVADDRAVVLTENWKPSGVGGHSSRGWGVVTNHSEVVAGLATTFASDAGWRDARRWRAVRDDVATEPGSPPANGSYPTRLSPARVAVERAELLRAPSGAGEGLVGLVDRANRSVDVLQMSIGDRRGRYVDALLRAAHRGVEVRVLLSSAWYVREDNRRLVRWLNGRAARDDLPLDARLAEPDGRFEKVHAKGLVVDDAVAVGSLNWNAGATTRNREVVLVLHGAEPARYFRTAFERDWAGGQARGLPVGLAVTAALGVAGAVAAGRKIRVA